MSERRTRIHIQEVSVRDGLQSEPDFLPTPHKIELINSLARTGLSKIEVTSFVSPKAIPNLRDAEEVMQQIERRAGVTYVALVPNERGAERALACAADEINLVMSAGEQHNLANMRMSCEQSLLQFARVVELLRGTAVRINGTIATAFGCPFEGDIAAARVIGFARRYLDMGMHSLTLADTTGMAHPRQVHALTTELLKHVDADALTLHFHNTRGMGLANVNAGISAGARRFDASLGGIGGCPFAPGATGNICSEDLVHMLELDGLDTGVDLDALISLARQLPELLGHDVPGQVLRAGTRSTLHRAA